MKSKFLQIILLLITVNVSAQTTIENFSYGTPSGTIADSITNPSIGGSIWRRHSGSNGQATYLGTSLTYAGYSSSGIGGSVGFSFTANAAQDLNRSTIPYTSGNVYVSFLLSVSASGNMITNDSYFLHLMDTAAPTVFRARLHIRAGTTAGTFRIGLGKFGTATPDSTINYSLNTPVLVVMKYGFYPGALNDSVTAYVFTSGVPTTEPAIPTLRAPAADMTNTSATDLAVVNAVAIRQHAGGIVGTIDGIRVSNTWGDGPLPVKLSSFEANVNDEITLLSWSTSSEINNKGFEIERSMDGKDFETIGFVKGNGNSNVLNVYSFKFESNESAFYRLKQIDFDGVYDYSKIVFVSNENSDDKSEFLPNPFVNEISIVNNERITKAEIMDITGKLVLSEEILNLNKASINTMSLKPGMYYLKIYTANSTETKRVIKNN